MSRLIRAGAAQPQTVEDTTVFGPHTFFGTGQKMQIAAHGSAFAMSVEHPAVINVMVTPQGEAEAEWGKSSFRGWSRVSLVPQPGPGMDTVAGKEYSVRLTLGPNTQTDGNDVFQITILEIEPMSGVRAT